MNSFAIAFLIAGSFLAQQPGSTISQTELPPLAGQAPAKVKPPVSSTTKEAAKAEPKKGRLTEAQKAAEKKAEEAKWGNKGKTEESAPLPEASDTPSSTEIPAPPAPVVAPPVVPKNEKKTVASSPGTGKRVAAFWLIIPGK